MEGSLSAQLSSTSPFGRIAFTKLWEETVNKDTQAAGGTIGFSLKPGAVTTHYLTAEHRSMCLRQLRHLIGQGRS